MDATPVFAALADPLRRSLLENLARHSPRTATQLARDGVITRQGILKHLRILEEACLVAVHQEGREKRFALTPEPLDDMERWLQRIGDIWDARVLRLKHLVESENPDKQR